MIDNFKEFLQEANKRIDSILVSKLRLLGYYPEDILSGDPKRKPDLLKVSSKQTPGVQMVDVYECNKIKLFTVIWKAGEIEIIDAAL